MIVLRVVGFALVLLCWELNWRGYQLKTALRFVAYYALFCWALGGIAYFFTFIDFWRLCGVVALAWVTGGWTRNIFGAGSRYSWRMPSLSD